MTLGECLHNARMALTPIMGDEEARWTVRTIIETLKGYTPADVALRLTCEITPWLENEVQRIVTRVSKGEPVQYVLGTARWHGMELAVNPHVLIPRPETSELVDLIVKDANGASDLRVLDLGTGSGAIAIALARFLRFPQVTALDLSEPALKVAIQNAKMLQAPVKCVQGNIFDLPVDDWDIIVSNPPYVMESEKACMEPKVLDHEPETALFVPDTDPLRFYKPILSYASDNLAPGGTLYLEINPLNSSLLQTQARKLFPTAQVLRDSYGKERFLKANKQSW